MLPQDPKFSHILTPKLSLAFFTRQENSSVPMGSQVRSVVITAYELFGSPPIRILNFLFVDNLDPAVQSTMGDCTEKVQENLS